MVKTARAPLPPHVRDSDTSHAAAESMRENAQTDRHKVLEFIRARGAHGATADEVQVELGLSHQNGSARVSELANRFRKIRPSALKRPTRTGRKAVVYVAT